MTCPHGNHTAPRTGGSCPCGLVTFIPAPAAAVCPMCATPKPTDRTEQR